MNKGLLSITEIPEKEQVQLDNLIKKSRQKYIRSSYDIAKEIIDKHPELQDAIRSKKISTTIFNMRELVWQAYLIEEANFNVRLMKEMPNILDTPKYLLDSLIDKNINSFKSEDLAIAVQEICGEYTGRVYPYIYKISLSNTNSRRSRAGSTFEAIIYSVYDTLGYSFDSQSKVGRKTFSDLGLGKKVDSILPSVKHFEQRRNKTIIGTMKTSLRERWQEVAEEIERTKIPEIHLITADESIASSKAKEMSNHNIIVVAYEWIANSKELTEMKNIISFEDYLFEEIPSILKFWDEA